MQPADRTTVLMLQLEEWRRKYDAIDVAYDRIRSRSVTLLTIQIGLVGYFITQLNTLIKPELYGILFFGSAVVAGFFAIYLTVKNYQADGSWLSPMYELEIERMNHAPTAPDAVAVLVDDYKRSYEHNLGIHEPAATRLNRSLFVSIVSAIMLLVLNFS